MLVISIVHLVQVWIFLTPYILVCIMLIPVPFLILYYYVGDFNVNISNPLHPLFSHLCSILDNFSFVQVVSDPTHTSPASTSSLIDLVMI